MRKEFKPRTETITISQETVDRLVIGQIYSEGGAVIGKEKLGVELCYSRSAGNCKNCLVKTVCKASLA